MKRIEKKVRNQPGLFKIYALDPETGKEIDTGKYRAVRRDIVCGVSQKVQGNFDNFEDARAFREKRIHKNESLSVHQISNRKAGMLFRELKEKFEVAHYATIDKSTMQTYQKLMPVLSWLDQIPVQRINNELLLEFGIYLRDQHPRTSRRHSYEKELQLLRVMLNFYSDEITEGETYNVPSFKKIRKMTILRAKQDDEVKYLSAEETAIFLRELKSDNALYHDIALVQYFFALRVGEAVALMDDVVNFDKMTVEIRRGVTWESRTWVPEIREYTKTKRARLMRISDDFEPELRRICDGKSGLLFQKDGQPINRKTLSTAYNRVLNRLGFRHVSGTHFLRKTAATLANEALKDFDSVSRYLGHSSTRVTRKYVGETSSQKAAVASALGNVLKQIGNDQQSSVTQEPVPQRPSLHLVK